MPTYEYRCLGCKKRFTRVEKMTEHSRRRACPKCGSRKIEQVFSPFYAKTVKKS